MSILLSEAQEDYLEAVYDIIDDKGGVRVKDIAERLGVKNSSVTVALRSLRDVGYLNYEPYGVISLTEQGRDEAKRLSETHRVFRRFFIEVLGVADSSADETACRLEHAISPEVMAPFLQFIKFASCKENSGEGCEKTFTAFRERHGISEDDLAAPAEYMNAEEAH
ncbi:MAG: metal-dependent transcriptional regulator [Spirochaetales bacterium]|nr:metal-dependent transcriptional regulator [Spirochaetales bacterium]